MHRADRVVGDAEDAAVGEVEVHRRRRLGPGGQLEDHPDAVDDLLLAGLDDLDRRRDEGDRPERGRLPEAGGELAVGPALEQRPVHVAGAARHRRAGEDVLADRMLEEAGRGEDRDPAGVDVLLGDDAAGAAEMVDVAVGVEQPGDGAIAALLAVEGERRRRGLRRDQRVDDDDALLALDHVHVREVEPAQLVEPGASSNRPAMRFSWACRQRAGFAVSGRIAVEETVGGEVPCPAPVLAIDHRRVEGGDEPPGCDRHLRGGRLIDSRPRFPIARRGGRGRRSAARRHSGSRRSDQARGGAVCLAVPASELLEQRDGAGGADQLGELDRAAAAS